jgi:hypothetical protein
MKPEWPLNMSLVSFARTNIDQIAANTASTMKIIFLQSPRLFGYSLRLTTK